MIFCVEFEEFKRMTVESATGFVFVQVTRYDVPTPDPGDPEIQRLTARYEMYTYSGPALVKTTKEFYDVKSAIIFEEAYMKQFKVVPISYIEDKEIVLNIMKG